MTDIEEKLGATLALAAQEAPDAMGLAAGARRRQRVRRQRRIAAGGVAAALVVAVSAVTLGAGGGDDVADDPTPTPLGAWQTISFEDARASLPPDWVAHDCAPHEEGQSVYAAPGEDPCSDGTGTVLDSGASLGLEGMPGAVTRVEVGDVTYWKGHVFVDQHVFNVFSLDRDLTRTILATARFEGQPVVDASQWVTFERMGITYEVPAFWGVGENGDRSAYSVCASPDRSYRGADNAVQQVAPDLVVLSLQIADLLVAVSAPTQAAAELVMATVDLTDGSTGDACTPEDFDLGLLPPEGSGGEVIEEVEMVLDVVEFDGIVLEVPAGWSRKEDCGLVVQFSPGEVCTGAEAGEGVRFLDPATFRPAMAEGEVIQSAEGARLWVGFVLRGEHAVFVTSSDKAVTQHLLSKVRP